MKKSLKAALWSALAFPGMGQIMLRLYLRGLCLAAVVTAALYYIVDDILSRGLVEKTNDLVDKAMTGQVPTDAAALEKLIDIGPDPLGVQIASWLIVFCWVFAIVDAWRMGARQDRAGSKG